MRLEHLVEYTAFLAMPWGGFPLGFWLALICFGLMLFAVAAEMHDLFAATPAGPTKGGVMLMMIVLVACFTKLLDRLWDQIWLAMRLTESDTVWAGVAGVVYLKWIAICLGLALAWVVAGQVALRLARRLVRSATE